MSKSDASPILKGWNTYWQGTGDIGAYTSGGVNHPAILTFWNEFFRAAQENYDAPKLIDIATGNGAVVERALEVLGSENSHVTCIDVAAAAIDNVHDRFPGVRGIVADARSIPLDDGAYDIATSQFGVEYAGFEAIGEAARLVADGGQLALLLHIDGGSVHKECEDSLAAITSLQESKFIPLSREVFRTGFDAVRGADRAPYEAAGKQLAPAVRAAESIIGQYGEHVAGDTVARLYYDVGRIHSKIQNYEPTEVLDWLSRMDGELEAYAERMSSMCEAAIDRESFDHICENLSGRGFKLERADPLVPTDEDRALAWVLIATR